MRKILLFTITIFIMFVYSNSVEANGRHGRFSKVNTFSLYSPYNYLMLNSNEIFYAESYSNKKPDSVSSAKLYNIKKKELIDLKSTMDVIRSDYGLIRYDDNHILVYGGQCEPYSSINKLDCSRVAEIYDIKNNKFTRIADTNYIYEYEPKSLLLSDGRVLIFDEHGELFNPKTRTFTKIPNHNGSNSMTAEPMDCVMELKPNEVLLKSKHYAQIRTLSVLDLKTYKETKIETPYPAPYEYYLGVPVKVSTDTVLFIGGGDDNKDVLKLDINTKKMTKHARLSKALIGKAMLLKNNEILFVDGCLEPWIASFFWIDPGKQLVHAVYDYKKNKIYKRRTATYFDWDVDSLYSDDNAVYFIDMSGKKDKLRMYSYKVKKENKK